MHHLKKIPQHGIAVLGEDGFRMELHAKGWMLPMLQPHDLAVIIAGGDFNRGIFRIRFDNQ